MQIQAHVRDLSGTPSKGILWQREGCWRLGGLIPLAVQALVHGSMEIFYPHLTTNIKPSQSTLGAAKKWSKSHPCPSNLSVSCGPPGTSIMSTQSFLECLLIRQLLLHIAVNIPIYSPFSLLFIVSITFLISFQLPLFRLYYLEAKDIFPTFFPLNTLFI